MYHSHPRIYVYFLNRAKIQYCHKIFSLRYTSVHSLNAARLSITFLLTLCPLPLCTQWCRTVSITFMLTVCPSPLFSEWCQNVSITSFFFFTEYCQTVSFSFTFLHWKLCVHWLSTINCCNNLSISLETQTRYKMYIHYLFPMNTYPMSFTIHITLKKLILCPLPFCTKRRLCVHVEDFSLQTSPVPWEGGLHTEHGTKLGLTTSWRTSYLVN